MCKILMVTLDPKLTYDRTLSYKQHIQNTKMKVATRNNLLKKLANSKWGTNASTIRTTALSLCYSIAEYAAPVWARSTYAVILDPELNKAYRAITGCIKPTYVDTLAVKSRGRNGATSMETQHVRTDWMKKIWRICYDVLS